MTLITVGLNHNTAPLAVRETLAFPIDQCGPALSRLTELPGVAEGAIVSTCNRTELYAAGHTPDDQRLRHWLCDQRGLDAAGLAPHFYVYRDRDSIRHALRVAAGLDSMILGEPQILGQMKEAFRQAQAATTAGPLLTRLFEHSFAVAKSVRSETDIGANPVSVAYAGVSLARQIFAEFDETTAMLIGAGDTIELTARHLAEAGVRRMIFANRSLDRAQALAERFTGYAIPLSDVAAHLSEADMVVTSTAAPNHVVSLANVRDSVRQRRRRPIFMLDLAVPRDIDPAAGSLEDVYLYSVDDLQGVIRDNLRSRHSAALVADGMIDERIDEFVAWMDSRRAVDTISQLRHRAEQQREAVLARARRMLAQDQSPDEVMQYLANTLTNKLMHEPTAALRRARGQEQQQLLEQARRLFDLPDEE
ncbi:glutamyl-tRNA reductase [Spectribacter hydrogenoxidans]|uniref:Glutamyl-tRNA reductase n=1 Tax=Spectribacter hydrogenoxidans TaxID=3075608 RepID=A0ABU3C1C5_9GAMM|nr:glutamyl-tRNA reductase [Salinisphaera sp. W335]MDT0635356.1 glutamyl-tRNA reductase [Salinisphaera sp. W335]